METISFAQNMVELVWVFVYPGICRGNGSSGCILEVECCLKSEFEAYNCISMWNVQLCKFREGL